ncbi:hypothetical protein Tco_0888224 [Tanacetum coccineum]
MSKVLQEIGFGSLPSSTKANPRDQVKSISTTIEANSYPIRRIYWTESYTHVRDKINDDSVSKSFEWVLLIDFASWQQRIRLYCQGKENGVNILKLIDEGPFQMGTIRDLIAKGAEGAQQLGPERARVYSDLSPEDKDRYNADIRTTNILLQGLLKDIYTLINHYTEAKDIWDNVKMLLEGSELTKEDRESQLYGDFEHFR